MAVFFHFNDINIPLKNRRKLKQFIEYLLEKEGYQLEQLHYIFCTDSFLLKINRKFLHHDTFTDIITFDLSEKVGNISAEIYISAERVQENADKFSVGFEHEVHRVIFHGALHLCGYRDKTANDKVLMRKKENENLKSYFNA